MNRTSKAKPPQQQSPRATGLRNFAAVPQRAISDKRFCARHHRVLGAVCRAVNSETCCALISQQSISRWANLARPKIGAVIKDLVAWGYLEVIGRGRSEYGRFKTHIYRIFYNELQQNPGTPGGDTGGVTSAGEPTTSPPGAAVSNILESNISASSKQSPRHDRSEACNAFKDGPIDLAQQAMHPGRPPIERQTMGQKEKSKQQEALNQVIRRKADRFENHRASICRGRLVKVIVRSFPEELGGSVIEAITEELLDRAARLEVRDPGAGTDLLRQAVTNHLATES